MGIYPSYVEVTPREVCAQQLQKHGIVLNIVLHGDAWEPSSRWLSHAIFRGLATGGLSGLARGWQVNLLAHIPSGADRVIRVSDREYQVSVPPLPGYGTDILNESITFEWPRGVTTCQKCRREGSDLEIYSERAVV